MTPGSGKLATTEAAIAFADLSMLSKAEVERIWLPWAIWLPAACAALPRDRVGPQSVRRAVSTA